MIKNNRPYTCENGSVDDKLLSEHDYDFIKTVGEWIRKNIRPQKEVNTNHTSYGLKHKLENDTGLYITNNEFKNAMLLAGYEPVDETELNWRYRACYLPDIIYNPSPFFVWVKAYVCEESPEGDFAKDMITDREFPIFANREIILKYLESIHAIDEAVAAFESLWSRYMDFNK